MNRPRKYFIAYTIWLFSAIKGRINFLQLKRFGKYCEQYYRIGFQRTFEFLDLNTVLLKGHLSNTLD